MVTTADIGFSTAVALLTSDGFLFSSGRWREPKDLLFLIWDITETQWWKLIVGFKTFQMYELSWAVLPLSYFKPCSNVSGTFTLSFIETEKYGVRIMNNNKKHRWNWLECCLPRLLFISIGILMSPLISLMVFSVFTVILRHCCIVRRLWWAVVFPYLHW